MPGKKKKLNFSFGFGLKSGQDPNQLLVPNLLDAKNVRFLKSNQVALDNPYSREWSTNLNIIKALKYKDEILGLTPTEIYAYRGNNKFDKIGDYLNAETEDIFIEYGIKSALEPSVNITNGFIEVAYRTEDNIFFKRLDLVSKNVIIDNKAVQTTSGDPGSFPKIFDYLGNSFVSYIKDQKLIIHSVDGFFNDIEIGLSQSTQPIDYTIEKIDRDSRLKFVIHFGTKTDIITYKLGETAVVETDPIVFSKDSQKKIAEDRKLFNMNHWTDITLFGNRYSIFYNDIGYFLIDSENKLVGKFYSDVPPPLNSSGVKLGSDPIQYSDTEVYIPFLVSDLSEEIVLGINLLKITVNEDVFLGSFTENFLEYFLGGSILKYFDGSKFVEQGFSEKPKITASTDETFLLESEVQSTYAAATNEQPHATDFQASNFGSEGNLISPNPVNENVDITKLKKDIPSGSLDIEYQNKDGSTPVKSDYTAIEIGNNRYTIGAVRSTGDFANGEVTKGTPSSAAVDAKDGSLTFTQNSIDNNITLTGATINSAGTLNAGMNFINGYRATRFLMFYNNQSELDEGKVKAYDLTESLTIAQEATTVPLRISVEDDGRDSGSFEYERGEFRSVLSAPTGFTVTGYTFEYPTYDPYGNGDGIGAIGVRGALTDRSKTWINEEFSVPLSALEADQSNGTATSSGLIGLYLNGRELNFPSVSLSYFPKERYFAVGYSTGDRYWDELTSEQQSFIQQFDHGTETIDIRSSQGSILRNASLVIADANPIEGLNDPLVTNPLTKTLLGTYEYNFDPPVEAAPAKGITHSRIGALTLENAPFNMTSFEFNITTKTITLVLAGTGLTQTSFTELRIKNSSGVAVAILNPNRGTFANGTYTWTETQHGYSSDPITSNGIYSFVFQVTEDSTRNTAINAKITGDKINFQFVPFGDSSVPSQTNISEIITVFGVTRPTRWESETLSAQAFSLNNQDYEIEKAVLSNESVILTFVKSQDANADINAMFLEITADGGQKIEYLYSEKSGKIVTFVPSIEIPGLPSGFQANFDETYSLKIPVPAQTLDDRLPSKAYGYLAIYSWVDQKGLNHYSEISNIDTVSNKGEIGATGASTPSIKMSYVNLTEKENAKIVLYRTVESGSTYLRVGDVLNFSQFKEINFRDSVKDEDLGEPYLYGIDSIKFQPPGAPITATFRNRLYLAGSKEFTNRVLVSDERGINSNAITFDKRYNDSVNLFFDYPVVGIAPLAQSLIIFTENKTYNYVPGSAPSEITSLESITLEDHRSLAPFAKGILFKSTHGIYNLNRGFTGDYIGFDVLDFNSKKVIDAKINEGEHEIFYVFDDHTTLKYNYYFNQWSRGINPAQTMYYDRRSDNHRIITSKFVDRLNEDNEPILDQDGNVSQRRISVIWVSDPNHQGAADVTGVLETGYFNLIDNAQGYQRVDEGVLLGDFGDFDEIRISVGYDWNEAFEDTHVFYRNTQPSMNYGARNNLQNQVSFAIKKPKSSSIKLRIYIKSKKAFLSNIAFVIKASDQLSKLLPQQRG